MASVVGLFGLAASCDGPDDSLGQDEAAVVVASEGIPRGSSWSYWDRGGDLGTAWRAPGFDDSGWATGAGPLGYGESYLTTTVGYGGDATDKHVTTYFRTQFTVSDPGAVRAIRGDLMYDDGIVIYLNGTRIGSASMPSGTTTAATFGLWHEARNTYHGFDWTAQHSLLRAGVNTIAIEVHQDDAASSDLVFDLGLVLELAAPPPPPPSDGSIARGSTWSYWDRGDDLGTTWYAGPDDPSGWPRGAGPLGYGESYLGTTIGYGGDPAAKHITTYFIHEFTVDDPAQVRSMLAELMYDDGLVVYLNGIRIAAESMPTGWITASTEALGHEAGNAYVSRDWTAQKSLLVAGVNTIAVEVHQQAPSSSDLVFDLALALTLGPPPPPPPPPPSDDLPRGSIWTYWDRGGDLGTAWRAPGFDDTSWGNGAGPLGYGETYHATTIGYGGDASNKHLTTYFRARFFIEEPSEVNGMLAELLYDDGLVVYINGQELVRSSMPTGTITASTEASNHEPGGGYEQSEWSIAARTMLVAGENVIAVEVHQSSPASSDLTFDLALTVETAAREPTRYGIPEGSTWGYWDRGGDLGTAWREPGYPETGWSAGAAPLGFGERYIATPTRTGPVTTYFRHEFQPWGSPTDWALEAKYDDGFIAYLNGTEVLRVGLPAGPITASTLATGHEASGYERFELPGAAELIVAGVNTLAIEVHQSAATSSDLVWDARLVKQVGGPTNWVAQDSGTTMGLTDVWFNDPLHGWVVGWYGTLLRTSDGGATWTPQASGVDSFLTTIEFADPQRGWIAAGAGGVLATVDGGNTWFRQSTTPAWGMSFVGASTGWITGNGIHRTDDGGATWQEQFPAGDITFGAIDFVDASHGWAMGRVEEGGDGEVSGGNVIFHTSDGGATWERQFGAGDWEQGFHAVDALSPTSAYVVGLGSNHTGLGEFKWVTRDGSTWHAVPDSANGASLDDVQFVGPDLAWAVGYAGSIIHSTDGGATWTVQEAAAWETIPDHTHPLKPSLSGVHFVDAQTGWAVGIGGTILTTRNGGNP